MVFTCQADMWMLLGAAYTEDTGTVLANNAKKKKKRYIGYLLQL